MRLEAKAIAAGLGGRWTSDDRPVHLSGATCPLELHTIGIRGIRIPTHLSATDVGGVVLAGLGGALNPSLRVGDVVIDGLVRSNRSSEQHHYGRIHTARTLVSTPEEKARLFEQTHAFAVDMEGDAAREVARSLDVPFLHVRGISDTADTTLDPATLHLIDDVGRVKPLSLIYRLLRRPGLVPQLKRLGTDSQRAATNVAAYLSAFFSQPQSPLVEDWFDFGKLR